MRSFRETAALYPHVPQGIYVETKKTTLDWMKLFHKHFPFETALPLDDVMQDLRLRKSAYEIAQMERSGSIHETVLDVVAPKLLHAGISEAELAIEIYKEMVIRGSHGTARFNQSLGKRPSGWPPSVRVVLFARGLTAREVRMGPALRCSPSGMLSAA